MFIMITYFYCSLSWLLKAICHYGYLFIYLLPVSETQKLYDDVNMGSEKINKTKVLSTYRWEIKQLLLNAIISAGMKVLESVGFDLNS